MASSHHIRTLHLVDLENLAGDPKAQRPEAIQALTHYLDLAEYQPGDQVLIAANPVFGLDFAAVQEIHQRILQVREKGGAVLLVSEDLDELLELADRIVVMSEGRIVFETPAEGAERHILGAHMGGGR